MKKVFILSLFAVTFILGTVYGFEGKKTIEVTYRNITMYFNDMKIYSDTEPFLYNGRTFVPLRVIAEAFYKDVLWDSVNNRIDIRDKSANNKGGGGEDPTVYVTNTGEKYHTANCRYLNESKRAIKLSEAKAQGYIPCKVCKPPE